MADLFSAVSQIVARMMASKGQKLFQPGKVMSVLEDGTYEVSINGAPAKVSVPQGDFPLWPGAAVWVSDSYAPPTWTPGKWTPLSYDPKTGTSTAGSYTPGSSTPGSLTPGHFRPVIHGKRVD